MEEVHIIKSGIKNIVSKVLFEKTYKPLGWKLDKGFEEQKQDIKELETITQVRNYNKSKKKTEKKFNDDLIKG